MERQRDRTTRIAGQVRLYVERVLPQLERAGGFPDSPMDRDHKGESNPPVGERAMLLWWVNRDAGKILNPLLRELRLGRDSFAGHAYRDMLEFCVYDSGAFARWLAVSQERQRAFWVMCLHTAKVAINRHGGDLNLEVDPNPDASADEEPTWNPNKVAPRWRPITKANKYRDVAARCERLREEYPDATEKAVWAMCSDELEKLGRNGSIGMIRLALDFVKAERDGNGGEAA